jgi:hypothetical protein
MAASETEEIEQEREIVGDRVRSKLERAFLVIIIPLFMAAIFTWSTWVTSKIFGHQLEMSTHATSDQLHAARDDVIRRIDLETRDINDKISKLPSADWRDRIVALERRQELMLENQAKMSTMLEVIKAQNSKCEGDP